MSENEFTVSYVSPNIALQHVEQIAKSLVLKKDEENKFILFFFCT